MDTRPGLRREEPLVQPLYAKTAVQLFDDFLATSTEAGARLPSERALCTRYGLSRVTLRTALRELQERGLVQSSRSRGWFITPHGSRSHADPRPSHLSHLSHHVLGFREVAAAQGLEAQTRIISTTVRACTVDEAETLRIAPGADLFVLHRLRLLSGLEIAVERNRIPLALCPILPKVDFETRSLYDTLRASQPPQIPTVADYSVEARAPTAMENELLGIIQPVPLLMATQLAFNQFGRPLEYTHACYRGDRYRFRASISSSTTTSPFRTRDAV